MNAAATALAALPAAGLAAMGSASAKALYSEVNCSLNFASCSILSTSSAPYHIAASSMSRSDYALSGTVVGAGQGAAQCRLRVYIEAIGQHQQHVEYVT